MSSINYLIKKVIRPNIIINSHHVFNFCSRNISSRNFTKCWTCNSIKHCITNSKCSQYRDDTSEIVIASYVISSYKNTNANMSKPFDDFNNFNNFGNSFNSNNNSDNNSDNNSIDSIDSDGIFDN